MSMMDALRRFEAARGYGVDAAGRPTYVGPDNMYASPRESATQMATHSQLKNMAGMEDPSGMMIRELLEQLRRQQPIPGNVRFEMPDLPNTSSQYDIRYIQNAPASP